MLDPPDFAPSLRVRGAVDRGRGRTDPRMLKLRGRVFLELREYERAVTVFEEARASFADDADLDFALGIYTSVAVRPRSRKRRSNASSPAVRTSLRSGRSSRGCARPAARSSKRELHVIAPVLLDASDACSSNLRGMIELDLELRDEALASFDAAVLADPAYAAPHFNRGMLALETQDVDRAVEEFSTAATLDPAMPTSALCARGTARAPRLVPKRPRGGERPRRRAPARGRRLLAWTRERA